ncbi:Holliday junction branch migration protein RuvA [Bifidobacterium xylocopae]|uniref:Holliday junction branch migration complex subunit RuvA n=1 Tax=Bifidobacterium xylocopae TaxID=2493119 RepID=A0A366KC18_9BIFI|nr:Holliday junction branch migration protein RuvA [Bifidobacterium xylocopae]RBP99286.1 Holliday junction branch migration protein RuvA [Bifidobacterium xylocopae]
MLAMLTGSVAQIEQALAVIDVGGVGYEVRMPMSDLTGLRTGTRVTVHTSLIVSQDSVTLYGFLSRTSKSLFVQLQKVSGIGPRVALSILSTLTPDMLAQAVSQGDATTLARAPGLGKKGAQKIILELSGKVDVSGLEARNSRQPADESLSQVIKGLVSLGWQERDAQRAVEKTCEEGGYQLPLDGKDVPAVLKAALTSMDRGR